MAAVQVLCRRHLMIRVREQCQVESQVAVQEAVEDCLEWSSVGQATRSWLSANTGPPTVTPGVLRGVPP